MQKLALAAAALLFSISAAAAQTTTPPAATTPAAKETKAKPKTPAKARSAESIECSKQADAQNLHGKERKKFRAKCMKDMKKKT